MAEIYLRGNFSSGEIAPSYYGRFDLPKVQQGCTVLRNFFVSYKGGLSSRAGMAFVGVCKQPASQASVPPRIISFRYSVTLSYILEFGDGYMRIATNGGYVTDGPLAITAATQSYPCTISVPGNTWSSGDWLNLSSISGMTQLNAKTVIITAINGSTVTLADELGFPLDSRNFSAYVSGGTAARLTTVASPYAAVDLPWLKVVQSADVMSLTCVNQSTGTEYRPYDLSRLAANNWQFNAVSFAAPIAAPVSLTGVASNTSPPTGQTLANYSFVVTAVDPITGGESNPSPAVTVNSVDIGLTEGAITLTWAAVPGASKYNIYQAPVSVGNVAVPIGSNYGYIGTAFGTQFVNSNIVPDVTTSPPLHQNPFAPSTILQVLSTGGGASYTQATVSVSVQSATGSGAVIIPVVVSGQVVAYDVQNGGQNYAPTDSVIVSDSGTGNGATASMTLAPATGVNPGVVSYFQSRRVYGYTLNNPDTLFLSHPSAYTNFDQSTPPQANDSIVTTPWGLQVNGVQWLQPMPLGLIVATGNDIWLMSGASGSGSAITPSSQSALAQESNGFSQLVKPIKIGGEILYVGSLNSQVWVAQYNYWAQVYSASDVSILSNHMFSGYQIEHWDWAKQPYKLVWATRNDGKLQSLTWQKEQEVIAWGRQDTNGLFIDVAVASESYIDAPYFLVKRFIVGRQKWAYFLERMDNRFWQDPENVFCVDAGLSLAQNAPNAVLSASAAHGPGTISGGYIAEGGSGYTAPVGNVIDPTGAGSGGSVSFTQTGGVLTAFTYVAGQNYSPSSYVVISDPTGSGATFVLFISQNVLFSASAAVFGSTQIGDVIRVGGGKASVTQVSSTSSVVASIIAPIIQTIPNDPNNLPLPAPAGTWTITTPVSTLGNLDHLEGMQVSVVADGVVVAGGDQPFLTVSGGKITLPVAASQVTVGLPFTAQFQTTHAEIPGMRTMQGLRKKIVKSLVRTELSGTFEVGGDQPIAAQQPYQAELAWTNMRGCEGYAYQNAPGAAPPLFTGDRIVTIGGDLQSSDGQQPSYGMISIQQRGPMPVNIVALAPQIDQIESMG